MAEPTQRDLWIQRSKAPRSPADLDYLTWQPIESWEPLRIRGVMKVRRKHGGRGVIRNPHYQGQRNVGEREIAAELQEIKQKFADGPLAPYLLAAVLMDRKVEQGRMVALIRSRFGRLTPLAHLLRPGAERVHAAVDGELETRLGFLPKYQLRWIGAI